MDYQLIIRVLPYFLEAAVTTISISLASFCLGLIAATGISIARASSLTPIRAFGEIYVSVFRGTPCLIQLFLIYFGGPQIGLNLDPVLAAIIGLALNIAAYIAESIRGSIAAVDRGQNEAAGSLGFGRHRRMIYVILPQAARLMVRSIGVNAVMLLKGSALVSTISVVDLTYTAQRFIGSTYRPFEIFMTAAAIYIAIVYPLVHFVARIDRRLSLS